ncbi:MAG TPA: hypothetical protein VMV79_02425 [Alphaproteobacteria bacterium]|nr:hypothetical protein [Alphaproteobacteria bacterium]
MFDAMRRGTTKIGGLSSRDPGNSPAVGTAQPDPFMRDRLRGFMDRLEQKNPQWTEDDYDKLLGPNVRQNLSEAQRAEVDDFLHKLHTVNHPPPAEDPDGDDQQDDHIPLDDESSRMKSDAFDFGALGGSAFGFLLEMALLVRKVVKVFRKAEEAKVAEKIEREAREAEKAKAAEREAHEAEEVTKADAARKVEQEAEAAKKAEETKRVGAATEDAHDIKKGEAVATKLEAGAQEAGEGARGVEGAEMAGREARVIEKTGRLVAEGGRIEKAALTMDEVREVARFSHLLKAVTVLSVGGGLTFLAVRYLEYNIVQALARKILAKSPNGDKIADQIAGRVATHLPTIPTRQDFADTGTLFDQAEKAGITFFNKPPAERHAELKATAGEFRRVAGIIGKVYKTNPELGDKLTILFFKGAGLLNDRDAALLYNHGAAPKPGVRKGEEDEAVLAQLVSAMNNDQATPSAPSRRAARGSAAHAAPADIPG